MGEDVTEIQELWGSYTKAVASESISKTKINLFIYNVYDSDFPFW